MGNKVKRTQGMKIGLTFALVLGALLLFGCSKDNGYSSTGGGGNGGSSPGPNEVWIQNFAFNPSIITVDAGPPSPGRTRLGLPFAFRVGRHGSLYGVGVALVLVLVYWAAFAISNALGLETVLPPWVAALSPNVLFGTIGAYLLLYVKT